VNWVAILIGAIGGLIYSYLSILLVRYKIDDPLDASPIHAGCGLWGIISTGLFEKVRTYIFNINLE
jgi:Amt family ammonium transporter